MMTPSSSAAFSHGPISAWSNKHLTLMTPYSLAYIPSPRTSPDLMAGGSGGGQQICVIACLSINPVSHCIVCTDKCF